MFSGDREHARKKRAKKSYTNLHQSRCVADILHFEQKSLEKQRQSGNKVNITRELGQKSLFALKTLKLHETYISRKLRKEVTRKNSRLKLVNHEHSKNLEVTMQRKLGNKRAVSWTPRSVRVK